MDKIERLNRETQEWRNTFVTRPAANTNSAPKYGTSEYWLNYWNNQTYKANNGQYSKKYF